MDPDMVRQQEEEEAASRLRKFVIGRAPSAPVREEAFVLRAEPREPFRVAPAAPAVKRSPGWGAVVRATTYCLLFTFLGFVGGVTLGFQLGLVAWQFLALGAAVGFLSGWQSGVAVLRKRYKLGVVQSYRAPLIPTFIILLSLVGGLAVILPVVRPSLQTAHASEHLVPLLFSLGVGAVAGFVLALPKMRANLRVRA